MSLPTAEEMTNLFLYGQKTKPSNLLDENLIRPSNLVTPLNVDVNEYMNGPGRFATLDKFDVVKAFFSPINSASLSLEPGTYTKEQLFTKFGFDGDANFNKRALVIHQAFYGVTDSVFISRAYLWATTVFQLNKDILFVVTDTGRYIENYTIEPYKNPNPQITHQESFDWKSDNWFTQQANKYLTPRIDPWGIGREVQITFDGTRLVNTGHFTSANFTDLQGSSPIANLPLAIGAFALQRDSFTQGLFDSSASTLDGDKPILYY